MEFAASLVATSDRHRRRRVNKKRGRKRDFQFRPKQGLKRRDESSFSHGGSPPSNAALYFGAHERPPNRPFTCGSGLGSGLADRGLEGAKDNSHLQPAGADKGLQNGFRIAKKGAELNENRTVASQGGHYAPRRFYTPLPLHRRF
jgi:hypothetical protein